jgi:hypothetical protein
MKLILNIESERLTVDDVVDLLAQASKDVRQLSPGAANASYVNKDWDGRHLVSWEIVIRNPPAPLETEEDCIDAKEKAEARLREIEWKLGERMKKFLLPFIHNQLISLDVTNNLPEDELVADWHDAHSNYVDWCRSAQPTYQPIVKRIEGTDDTTDVSSQLTLNIKE